ncbi:MAG: FMN-binding protein [Negativicutes bacterium]|nr:FMN-binding protein [Negativicutes bacterium]
MKDMVRYAVTLALIAAFSGGAISATVGITTPITQAREAKELQESLTTLLPEATSFSPSELAGETYYIGAKDGKTVGYLVNGSANGYGGAINVLVAFNANGTVRQIKILSHSETPGIGSVVIESADFAAQFVGKEKKDAFEVGKDIIAISGASRSSRGVTGAVKDAVTFLNQNILP